MNYLFWIVIAFFCGSLPFSVWLGRAVSGRDVRDVGDGNPGATNVGRVGGAKWGVLAAVLDILKAAIPVGYVYWFVPDVPFWTMVAVALAPIIGHAFSPFLRFKGGKAVAASGGTWIGLTVYEFITVGGLMLLFWYKSVKVSGWAVMLMMGSVGLYMLLAHPDPLLMTVWAGNTLLLAWKHRDDLRQPPGVRDWVKQAAGRFSLRSGANLDAKTQRK